MAEAASRGGGKLSSLVNNLAMSRERDYEVVCATAEDLFPWMANVEVAALLTRLSNRKADSYMKLNVKMEDYYRIKDNADEGVNTEVTGHE